MAAVSNAEVNYNHLPLQILQKISKRKCDEVDNSVIRNCTFLELIQRKYDKNLAWIRNVTWNNDVNHVQMEVTVLSLSIFNIKVEGDPRGEFLDQIQIQKIYDIIYHNGKVNRSLVRQRRWRNGTVEANPIEKSISHEESMNAINRVFSSSLCVIL